MKEQHTSDIDKVLTEYGGLLSRVASAYEANTHLQEELLQEICVAVWQALSRFNHQSNVKTYILRIAHNRAVSHISKEMKTVKSQQGQEVDLYSIASMNQSPEEQTQNSRKIEQLLDAVRRLKLPAKQVLTMSMEGLSYQEISDITGFSVNNVGVMINRARASIAKEVNND